MPRFYLNVIGTRHSKDDEGVVFASPGEALAHATEVARELGEDRPRGITEIVVVDEHGAKLAVPQCGRSAAVCN